MRESHTAQTWRPYRDYVTQLMAAHQPFGDVEDLIDAFEEVPDNVKAALWLLAFSLRDQSDQVSDAHTRLASIDL